MLIVENTMNTYQHTRLSTQNPLNEAPPADYRALVTDLYQAVVRQAFPEQGWVIVNFPVYDIQLLACASDFSRLGYFPALPERPPALLRWIERCGSTPNEAQQACLSYIGALEMLRQVLEHAVETNVPSEPLWSAERGGVAAS
jgi:glutathione S-transferase